jgi:hypothetical protein
MRFGIGITSGGEVKWDGIASLEPIYYGGPTPESGSWKLDMGSLGYYIGNELASFSFGESIDAFVLGFEIGDLDGWGNFFTPKPGHAIYRPKMKLIESVGQLNWPDVKDLDEQRQFERFADVLVMAISRVSAMKRKPKDFDVAEFSTRIQFILAACPLVQIRSKACAASPAPTSSA